MSIQHFCWNCGFIGEGDKPSLSQIINKTDDLNDYRFITLSKYEWVKGGVWKTLHIISDKELSALDNDDLYDQLINGKTTKTKFNDDGEESTETVDIGTIDHFHVCPECNPKCVMIDTDYIKTNPDHILYLLIEHGITKDPIRKIIREFDAKLIPEDYRYNKDAHFGSPLHAIVNGNNKNDIYKWLYGSGLMTGDDNQVLLRYASMQKFKDEQRNESNLELLRQIVDNGAEWKDLDIPYIGLGCIMTAHKGNAELSKQMIKYHFVRSTRTGQENT